MNKSEILKELNMNYNDLCEYLLKKYGKAKYDYFCKSNCKSRNRKIPEQKKDFFVIILTKIRRAIFLIPILRFYILSLIKRQIDWYIAII